MSGRYDDHRIKQTQNQVDEVVGIMKNNVEKVLERDQKLGELEDKSDRLRDGAARFQTTSRKLKRKMWWKNLKFMLILGTVIVVVLLVIILIAVKPGSK